MGRRTLLLPSGLLRSSGRELLAFMLEKSCVFLLFFIRFCSIGLGLRQTIAAVRSRGLRLLCGSVLYRVFSSSSGAFRFKSQVVYFSMSEHLDLLIGKSALRSIGIVAQVILVASILGILYVLGDGVGREAKCLWRLKVEPQRARMELE